jgi:hypothetical protein
MFLAISVKCFYPLETFTPPILEGFRRFIEAEAVFIRNNISDPVTD